LQIADPKEWFEEKEFTEGEEPKKSIKSFDEIKGKRLNKTLSPDHPVTTDDLMDPKGGSALPAVLPKGYGAIAVRGNAESGVSGFIQPQHHVNVICTVRGSEVGVFSRTILKRVLVLAVDLDSSQNPDVQAKLASTVTLQVKPEQAELLSMAASMGDLRLVE